MDNNYLKAIYAAVEAGLEIMEVYTSNDFGVEAKGDNSPLTKADTKGHNKIVEILNSTGIPILSEEGKELPYNARKEWLKLWVVDPLDGTKEFIKRNGEFTVNIAMVNSGEPVFGVIYVPVTRELYFGIKGIGSFKTVVNGQLHFDNIDNLIELSVKLPLKTVRNFTVVASRSHMSVETEEFINKLKSEHKNLDFISKGSSLKLCAVAEGVADIYPRFAPTMEWDTAAGQAIVEAMGGKVTKVTGESIRYNREDLLNPWFIAKA